MTTRRITHGLTAAAVLLATGAANNSCQATDGGPIPLRECWIDTRGIEISGGGFVQDIVTARCAPTQPQTHTLQAWLEYRDGGGEYRQVGQQRFRSEVPDGAGVSLRVSAACQPGRYRAAWRAYGESSQGIPFDITDHDFFATPISETDCRG